jgi:hypothetical protein
MITKEDVVAAILKWPGLYQRYDGTTFKGMPVSQVPAQLIQNGWRRVSRLDESDFRKMGLEIVTARYVGGARPKRFCAVVVACVDDSNPSGEK